MKCKLLFVILLVFCTKNAFSDEYFPFVEFTCIPEANYLKVRAEGFYNIDAYGKETAIVKEIETKSNLNYVGWENPFSKSCTINGKRIQIDIKYRQPQASGECGGEERADLKISVDGSPIIDGARFHSECFDYSVKELDFSSFQYGSFSVCGRYTTHTPYKNKNVCAGASLNETKKTVPVNIEALFKEFAADL